MWTFCFGAFAGKSHRSPRSAVAGHRPTRVPLRRPKGPPPPLPIYAGRPLTALVDVGAGAGGPRESDPSTGRARPDWPNPAGRTATRPSSAAVSAPVTEGGLSPPSSPAPSLAPAGGPDQRTSLPPARRGDDALCAIRRWGRASGPGWGAREPPPELSCTPRPFPRPPPRVNV